MKKVTLLLLLFCCSFYSYGQRSVKPLKAPTAFNQNTTTTSDAQRTCATDEYHAQKMQDPDFADAYNKLRDKISEETLNKVLPPCANPLIIPVAVHYGNAVTAANQQCLIDAALAQVEQMNLDFAGCNTNQGNLCDWINAGCDAFGGTAGADAQPVDGACIQFCLADQNLPAGEDNIGGYGITVGDYTWTGGVDAPVWSGYMNIFVGTYIAGGVLGVAPLAGGSNPNGDGVYVLASAFGSQTFGGCTSGTGIGNGAPFNGGATCTHEVGHYFGLDHTWTDGLADTPNQNNPNYGCPTVNTATCAATGCQGACDNYAGNFMDYVDDDCMFTFTEDQVMLMQATAAAQGQWETGSVSCVGDYPPCPQQGACLVACPTVVNTPYSGTEEHCGSAGAYPLPTDFSAVVLDDNSDATYTWSTGGYISAGGTALAGPDYAVTPPGCEPITETLYLNVGCNSDAALNLDAGTLDLTVYPDPSTFAVADLVTFTDGDCAVPTWVVTAGCETFVTVTPLDEPATVNTGDSGTVNYDVTVTYPAACCATVGPLILVDATIGSTTLTSGDANSISTCVAGTTPEQWEISFTIPALANATTVGTSSGTLGAIEEICLDVMMNESQVAILSLDVPNCGGYNWENLWEGAAFGNTTSAGVINVCFTPGTPDSSFDGTFDGDDGTDGSFAACDWTTDNFILYIADYGCYLATPTPIGGVINSATVTINDGNDVGMPICDFTATANYACMAMGMPYCNDICFTEYNANPGPDDTVDATLCVTPTACGGDASCETTQACDDGDPCTINDMETILNADGSVCVPCAGTVDPMSCDAACVTTQACDDGDPCTTNDMETLAADGSVCVPCAGTVDPMSCDAACATTQACDDGDPCTTNDMETLAADGSVCVPCAGTVDTASCDAACVTLQACDDGDPCTTGEQESVNADGGICEPCGLNAMAVTPACGDPAATNYDMNATCIDNTLCTYGEYCDNICYAEYAANPGANDTPNAMLCVTPLSCADSPDASCIGTRACDDGDPCTTGEEETYTLADGTACGDCGLNATPVTPACGDPTAENYDANATCIDNSICTYMPCEDGIAGTITLPGCDFTGTMVTIIDASGAVVGTAIADMAGNYALAGPFPCGSYTAEITSPPACYTDENGDVGPRQFNINGDGTADGYAFGIIPESIPTVGEWGLIILGLMMSIVAVVGIRARREEEVYG